MEICIKKKVRLMINEEKYLEWMEEYFNPLIADENIDINVDRDSPQILAQYMNAKKLENVSDNISSLSS